MAKNQNIDRQPNVDAKMPPRRGPSAGPTIDPSWKKAEYVPLSLGSAISATQPDPMLMTADPPVAFGQPRHMGIASSTHLEGS